MRSIGKLAGTRPQGILWDAEPGPKHIPLPLEERWRSELLELDAPQSVLANLDALTQPSSLVVVTGQQPGPWGGPLYALYKAATAAVLAARLRAQGRPAVAVFWMGADDVDQDEVRFGCLPDKAGKLHRQEWPAGESRSFVGDLKLARKAPDMGSAGWGEPPAFYPEAPAADLGEGFLRMLLDILGPSGLVPLDARWGELRDAGTGLWRAYLGHAASLASALKERGESLSSAGEAAPLDPQAAGLFVIEDGRRLEPEADWAGFAQDALDGGKSLAPSVLLRAPLQDHLFGTWAHVVGDGEAAYLKQLAPIYEGLGVHIPQRLPRLAATIVPGELAGPSNPVQLAEDSQAALQEFARASIPETGNYVKSLRDETRRALEGASTEDASWNEVLQSASRKVDYQFQRLEEALEQQGRRTLYQLDPRWRHLVEFIHPRRGPQDRSISGSALSFWFSDVREPLLNLAEAHVESLLRGDREHFVLEAEHG